MGRDRSVRWPFSSAFLWNHPFSSLLTNDEIPESELQTFSKARLCWNDFQSNSAKRWGKKSFSFPIKASSGKLESWSRKKEMNEMCLFSQYICSFSSPNWHLSAADVSKLTPEFDHYEYALMKWRLPCAACIIIMCCLKCTLLCTAKFNARKQAGRQSSSGAE